jgi:hypothetical protein
MPLHRNARLRKDGHMPSCRKQNYLFFFHKLFEKLISFPAASAAVPMPIQPLACWCPGALRIMTLFPTFRTHFFAPEKLQKSRITVSMCII